MPLHTIDVCAKNRGVRSGTRSNGCNRCRVVGTRCVNQCILSCTKGPKRGRCPPACPTFLRNCSGADCPQLGAREGERRPVLQAEEGDRATRAVRLAAVLPGRRGTHVGLLDELAEPGALVCGYGVQVGHKALVHVAEAVGDDVVVKSWPVGLLPMATFQVGKEIALGWFPFTEVWEGVTWELVFFTTAAVLKVSMASMFEAQFSWTFDRVRSLPALSLGTFAGFATAICPAMIFQNARPSSWFLIAPPDPLTAALLPVLPLRVLSAPVSDPPSEQAKLSSAPMLLPLLPAAIGANWTSSGDSRAGRKGKAADPSVAVRVSSPAVVVGVGAKVALTVISDER